MFMMKDGIIFLYILCLAFTIVVNSLNLIQPFLRHKKLNPIKSYTNHLPYHRYHFHRKSPTPKIISPPSHLLFLSHKQPEQEQEEEQKQKQNKKKHPNNHESKTPQVLCIGETLWDILPNGMFLGGAPTNVAIHLSSLGVPTSIVSCINRQDELGIKTLELLQRRGVLTEFVQSCPDSKYGTGKVVASIDSSNDDSGGGSGGGDATYVFDTPSAWDYLRLGDVLRRKDKEQGEEDMADYEERFMKVFSNVDVIVMGSICARLESSSNSSTSLTNPNVAVTNDDYDGEMEDVFTCGATSAESLFWVRTSAKDDSLIFDVNLRPPWYTPERVLKLARGGVTVEECHPNALALLKVNEDELSILEDWCDLFLSESGENDNNKTKPRLNKQERPLFGNGLRERMERLGHQLNTKRVCVTRGEHGAALWCDSSTATTVTTKTSESSSVSIFVENEGYSTINKDEESDTVGAGDSFLAAVLRSLFLEKETPQLVLQRGCALGGFVAGCQGAVPDHENAPLHLRELFTIS